MGGADDDVASRGVDMSSRPRQLYYPQGSFSVITNPQREGFGGSLSPTFVSGFVVVRNPVKPAFAFTLYVGFLTRLS
jgi:hypothetical protein